MNALFTNIEHCHYTYIQNIYLIHYQAILAIYVNNFFF